MPPGNDFRGRFIISGLVVPLFGASTIPKFARSMGIARPEFEWGEKD